MGDRTRRDLDAELEEFVSSEDFKKMKEVLEAELSEKGFGALSPDKKLIAALLRLKGPQMH